MKITSVQCILLSAPYGTAEDAERIHHLSSGYRAAAIVKIETDEGLYGLGEPYAGSYAPLAIREIVAQLAELLVGLSPLDLHTCVSRIQYAIQYWGGTGVPQGVAGALEMALYDIKGKAFGLPVYELLGGRVHTALPIYASGGNDKPEPELRREMQGYIAAGYGAVKIRINNLSPRQFIEKVQICSDALEGKARLALDAVQNNVAGPWSLKQAQRYALQFEPFDLLWLEEPLPAAQTEELAELRRTSSVPIAGGESLTTLTEANRFFAARSLDIFQPDATVIGGVKNLVASGALAAAAGMDIAVHAWCGGVGHMANYHAGFATPNCLYLELSSVPNPLRDRFLVEPIRIEKGRLNLPRTPGLGVHLPPDIEREFPFREGSHYKFVKL